MGELGRALKDYDKAIDLDPNYLDAYNNRGNAYFDLGEHRSATLTGQSSLILLMPLSTTTGAILTVIWVNTAVLSRITTGPLNLSNGNAHANTYHNRGYTYFLLTEYRRAIEDYDKAIELDPTNANAYHNRGYAYYLLDDHRRATDDLNKALTLTEDPALRAYVEKALAELQQ